MSTLAKEAEYEKSLLHGIKELERIGAAFSVVDKKEIQISLDDDSIIKFFPYTGWFTGKRVKDGRGIKNLINQLSLIL